MARRRMIAKSISISEQVNDLSDFAALLFTWMIAHADDFGRLPGAPKRVKALVVPMRRQGNSDVEKALQEMEAASLIWWYVVDGEKFIQFRKWDEHQEGLHKRTISRFPAFPGNSGKAQEIPSEEKRREEKRREENPPPTPPPGAGNKNAADKTRYAEFVSLTEAEHASLLKDFAEADVAWMIDKLNNYKGANGKKYKSDYMAIRNWVVDRLREEKAKGGVARSPTTDARPDFSDLLERTKARKRGDTP